MSVAHIPPSLWPILASGAYFLATPAPKPDAKCPTIGGVTVHTGDVPDGAILPFVGGAKCSSCGEVAKPDATVLRGGA